MSDSPSDSDADANAEADDPSGSSEIEADDATDADTTDPLTDAETADAPTEPEHTGPPDSRWWYWVAALPIYFVVATVVGFAVGAAAFVMALTGASMMGPGMGAPLSFGLGIAGVALVVMLLFSAGMLLSLVFPLAIYLDADAVADLATDWNPDPALYGILGLAGIVAQPLQAPLAVYYLYKRHESVGVP